MEKKVNFIKTSLILIIVLACSITIASDYHLINDIKRDKKVAFYPGSFDPPHRSHLQTIKELIEDYGFDKVVVSVNTKGPKNYLSSIKDRMDMVRAMTEVYGSKVEITFEPTGGKSPLWKRLEKKFNDVVYRVGGADRWEIYTESEKNDYTKNWIIMPRPELTEDEEFKRQPNLFIFKRKDYGAGVSSSELRAMLAQKEWPAKDMHPEVLKLIKNRSLYQFDVLPEVYENEWNHFISLNNLHGLEMPSLKKYQTPRAWRDHFVRMAVVQLGMNDLEAEAFWRRNELFISFGTQKANCFASLAHNFFQ